MDAAFREVAAERRVEAVPLSHLSIELGHLYMEDFVSGPHRVRAQLQRVALWAEAARRTRPSDKSGRRARVSTCFLIDDYFTRFSSPAEVLPMLLDAAEASELRIDYLGRESACAEAEGVSPAMLVTGRLTAVPPPGSNGSRPPASEVGWLSNGQRSPADDGREAMRRTGWAPPVQIDARNHSVFVDVELWSERDGRRYWSCAFLAAVWQLMRLGLLRNGTASVVHPRPWTGGFPDDWDELPAITQLNPSAAPFCAYRAFSVLPSRFLQTEHAVRIILEQVAPITAVTRQIAERSTRDENPVSPDVTGRVDYVFFNEP